MVRSKADSRLRRTGDAGFGLVDYCRVSCDVELGLGRCVVYAPVPPGAGVHKAGHQQHAIPAAAQWPCLWQRPGCVLSPEENCKLTAKQKRTLATVNALLGNVFLTSDMPSHYTDAQRAEYRRLRTLFEHATQVQAEAENDRLYIRYLLDGTPQKLCFDLF